MIVASAIQKMIDFYKGNLSDIDHFLKVWAMAKTIGELESLDKHTLEILELAAVVHDISCPLFLTLSLPTLFPPAAARSPSQDAPRSPRARRIARCSHLSK